MIAKSVYVKASRLSAQARAEGRAAFYRHEALEYCPYVEHERFYLACLWKIGWQEGESEASRGWLAKLTTPDDCADVSSHRFNGGAASSAG